MPPLLKEMEYLRQVVWTLTAKLIWVSGVDVPQGKEVAAFGVPLLAGSLPVPPKRINGRVTEQMVDATVPQMKQENVKEPVVEVVRLVPQARVQRVGEHIVDVPIDAGETDWRNALSEIEGNGGAGETDRRNALLEIGTKACEAGTDSACQTTVEVVPVEGSLLQFGEAVGGTLVVAQMQISMLQTGIEALRV